MSGWVLVAASGLHAAQAGVFPYEITTRELDNGLTVHVVPMPSPGTVAWYGWMAVGSRDEVEEGRTGFAHFFEHLMFYGTEEMGGDARERAVLRLGAEENAWTWLDETVYHATLPASRLEAYVAIEADRFLKLYLTPEDVRREAGAVYGEFRKSQADPDNRLSRAVQAAAFTTHTYGHDTLGYEADIAAMPGAYDHAMAFFDRFYRPENTTIVVVGDVTVEPTLALIEAHFRPWERGTVPRPEVPVEPEQTTLREVRVSHPGPTAPRLTFAWKIPAHDADDPDVAALQLAGDLLLASVGPLKRRLVREEGVAYAVYGGRQDLVDPGLFEIVVQLKDADGFEVAERIVREEVASLGQGVDKTLLDRVRQNARYRFLTRLDSPDAVASALGSALRRDPRPDTLDREAVTLDAVTGEGLAETVTTFLVDARLTVGRLEGTTP